MTYLPRNAHTWLAALALAGFTACVPQTDDGDGDEGSEHASPAVEDPVLEDASILLEGAPSNDELPEEGKADQELPPAFVELQDLQSPVKSQGSRGVCSIFATAAYMEHLYIAEGTITDPDFSEQYLQWSVKFEVGSFPNTSGSNSNYNLQAISDYGIPEEQYWPYEPNEWGAADDPACAGDESARPTRCFTNGEPPQEALDAEKFRLPRSRYISTRTRDIKSHIYNTQTGVQVGGTFFYQSWNHSRSELPRNMEYWRKGYVLYPNEEDRRLSLEKRAGHSFLLVGWDDNLEVPMRDENGDVMLDADGQPLTERGFFLFKNSWGTGSFGSENPYGDGYGWISYRYVQQYLSGRVAAKPELQRDPEICGDGIDNDGNFAVDCDDDACASDPICTTPEGPIMIDLEVGEGLAIPDNDPAGLEVPFVVEGSGIIQAFSISVHAEHTYRGDLSVRIVHPDGTEQVLEENSWDPEDDLTKTYVVEDFVGKESAGTYRLIVADHYAIDTGTLRSATVELVR